MAQLERWEMEYIYQDGDGYVFMDPETCDQITLPHESAGDRMLYLKEGMRVHVVVDDGKPFALEPPGAVELTITDIDPDLTQATAAGSYQCAALETGLKVMVPAFVRAGETIIVDTHNGRYLGRVTQARMGARAS